MQSGEAFWDPGSEARWAAGHRSSCKSSRQTALTLTAMDCPRAVLSSVHSINAAAHTVHTPTSASHQQSGVRRRRISSLSSATERPSATWYAQYPHSLLWWLAQIGGHFYGLNGTAVEPTVKSPLIGGEDLPHSAHLLVAFDRCTAATSDSSRSRRPVSRTHQSRSRTPQMARPDRLSWNSSVNCINLFFLPRFNESSGRPLASPEPGRHGPLSLDKNRHHSEAAVGVGGLRMAVEGATTQYTSKSRPHVPCRPMPCFPDSHPHPREIPTIHPTMSCLWSGLQLAYRPENHCSWTCVCVCVCVGAVADAALGGWHQAYTSRLSLFPHLAILFLCSLVTGPSHQTCISKPRVDHWINIICSPPACQPFSSRTTHFSILRLSICSWSDIP